MKKNIYFINTVLALLLLFAPVTYANQAPEAFNPFENMSEQEMASLQQSIEEELERELNKMSPEERKKFDEFVEQISQMDEKELESFITQMFDEEAKQQAPDKDKAEPIVQEPEKKDKDKPEPAKPKLTSKHEKALAIIDDLIKYTNSFIQKTAQASIAELLPAKIQRWKKDKKLQWSATTEWGTMKKEIETLVQKLHTIKDMDPQTKVYKYLDDFIADTALYNNLTQLLNTLTKAEPKIEAPELAAKGMKKTANQAIRDVLNSFEEAFAKLKITPAIDKVITTYEPKAKEQREREEKAAAQAREESKKPRKPTPAKTAGRAERDYDYYSPDYGYPSHPSNTMYTPSSSSQPSSFTPTTTPAEQKKDEKKDLGMSIPAGKNKKSGKGDDETAPDKKPSKDISADELKKLPKLPEYKPEKEDRSLIHGIGSIATDLDAIAKDINQHKSIVFNIENHLTDATKPVDATLAQNLPKMTQTAHAALEAIKTLQRKTASFAPARKNYFKQELDTAYKEHAKTFDTFIEQVKKVKDNWASIEGSISTEKRMEYLGFTSVSDDINGFIQALAIKNEDDADKYYTAAVTKFSDPAFKKALDDLKQAIIDEDKDAMKKVSDKIDKLIKNEKGTEDKNKPSFYMLANDLTELKTQIEKFSS